MTLLGKRWTGVVLGSFMQGPAHFADLRRSIPGISDRVLNERLLELATLDLVTRTVVDGRPIRVRYELTEHGYAIRPAIEALAAWPRITWRPSTTARLRDLAARHGAETATSGTSVA